VDFGGRTFVGVRAHVLAREQAGKLDPEIGGHEIIVQGQIPNYVSIFNNHYSIFQGKL
jgi:hypothetical protein